MLPAVEMAYRVPAVDPTEETALACSRTAKGETVPRKMLGTRKRMRQASRGPSRTPMPLSAMARLRPG